jgi:hypothetical protein
MNSVHDMKVGQAYTWSGLDQSLGRIAKIDGVEYVVVQMAAAYTAGVAGVAMTTARDSDGVPTWIVSKGIVANSPDVAGFGPASATGSFAADSYALIQRSGVVASAVAGATTCDNRHLTTDTAFGVKTILSASETQVGANVVARALANVASSVANIEIVPSGLVPSSVP